MEEWKLFTFLNLPDSHVFHTKKFARALTSIRLEIKNIADLCMKKARDEEIINTIGEELFGDYQKHKLTPSRVLLTIMCDVGWNIRSSENKNNSISGYKFLLGWNCCKILNCRCMLNYCRKYSLATWKIKKMNTNARRIAKVYQNQ